jgi:hypothetical protein
MSIPNLNDLIPKLNDVRKNKSQYENIYLGKNVEFKNSQVAYVTNLGYIRKYKDKYSLISGKNGCPKSVFKDQHTIKVSINKKENSEINVNGVKLIIGPDMVENAYCGKEGSNVIVTQNPSINDTYKGCFVQDASLLAFNPDNKFYSYDSCKQLANEKGKQYFGIANSDNKGYGNCVLVDSIPTTKKYEGDTLFTTNSTTVPIINNLSSIASIIINDDGNIDLFDSTSNKIGTDGTLRSTNGICGDNNGGIGNIKATYGKSCLKSNNSNSDKIFDGNATDIINNYLNQKNPTGNIDSSKIYNITIDRSNGFTDVAPGCKKDFLMTYSCGADSNVRPPIKFNKEAWKSKIPVTCQREIKMCNNYLIINDNGTVTINQPSSNYPAPRDKQVRRIFTCPIDDKLCVPNNKISLNEAFVLLNGEQFTTGSYLASKNKKYKLNIENGVLKFTWYTNNDKCSVKPKVHGISGNANTVALYGLETIPANGDIGKMAYIDGKSNLHLYPENMKPFTNTYGEYKNYDMASTTIRNLKVANTELCRKACDKTDTCHGFRFKKGTNKNENNCFFKGPSNDKIPSRPNEDSTLYVKNKNYTNSDYCSKKTYNISSNEFNTYRPARDMKKKTKCINLVGKTIEGFDNIESEMDKINYSEISDQINATNSNFDKYDKVKTKYTTFIDSNENYNGSIDYKENMANIEETIADTNRINNEISNQITVNNLNYVKYGTVKEKYTKFIDSNGNYSIDYKENMENMNTINEMLSDSDLLNVQQKYQNIFWSILAIGTIVFAISNIKK